MVQYCGSRADREVIRAHEFHYAGDRGKRRPLKFDVLLVRPALLWNDHFSTERDSYCRATMA